MNLAELREAAEKMAGALPLAYSPGECDAFLTFATGEDAACVFGQPPYEDLGAKDVAEYLALAANALPGLLAVVEALLRRDAAEEVAKA